jgi:hypothetical protein
MALYIIFMRGIWIFYLAILRWKAMLKKMEEVDAKVAAGEDTHRPMMVLGPW